MRLSWFAQLFGKKKPAAASGAGTAAAGAATPGPLPRYRGEVARGGSGTTLRPGAERGVRFDREELPATASAPQEIVPRRARAAAAAAAASSEVAAVTLQRAAIDRADERSAAAESGATSPAERPVVEVNGGASNRLDALVKATPMPAQEELSLKVSEGLRNLTSLLTSIDEKMLSQHRATELVAERLQALPRVLEGLVDAEKQNLETLRDLRGSMEKQSAAALAATEKLEQLPNLVDGIGARIEKQTESAASVKTSVESVGQSVRGLVDGAQRTQNSLITEFRRGQDEQRQRLEELVERQRKTIMVVAVIGAFLVLGVVIVLARMPK